MRDLAVDVTEIDLTEDYSTIFSVTTQHIIIVSLLTGDLAINPTELDLTRYVRRAFLCIPGIT